MSSSEQSDPEYGRYGSYTGFTSCGGGRLSNPPYIITATGKIDGDELRITTTVKKNPNTRSIGSMAPSSFIMQRVDYCRNVIEHKGTLTLREDCR